METGAVPAFHGVFTLGAMHLALPLEALREVVPCVDLQPLPCQPGWVVGGVDLRGALVPVIDLRRMFEQTCGVDEPESIVIMTHAGRLLGMLVNSVSGVFSCSAGQISRIEAMQGDAPVLCGSIQLPEHKALISMLSPAAIAAMPGMPMVIDPETHIRSANADAPASGQPEASEQPGSLLLLRSGGICLAIESRVIHTTLLNPAILPSVLTGGACQGVIEFAGWNIPVLDLAAYAGLPVGDVHCSQAFVIAYGQGFVAFMVEEIVDVFSPLRVDCLPVPSQGVGNAALFAGALPASLLSAHLAGRGMEQPGFCLLLDHEVLAGGAALSGLASMSVPAAGDRNRDDPQPLPAASPAAQRTRQQVVTFDLGFEVATPIVQIVEIIPWDPERVLPAGEDEASGMLMSRGRMIPICCLCRRLGRGRPPLTHTAAILVVEVGGQCLGFLVPALLSIEEAVSQAVDAPMLGKHALSGVAREAVHWSVVWIGTGSDSRMVNMLQLIDLAALQLAG